MKSITLYERLMHLKNGSTSKSMEEWAIDDTKNHILEKDEEEEEEIEHAHFESDHENSILDVLDSSDRSETRPRRRRKAIPHIRQDSCQ